jgi:hypothetical protein
MSWITSISQLSSAVNDSCAPRHLLISVGLSMHSIRLPFFSINPRLILRQFLSIGGRNPTMNFLITLFLLDPATPVTSSAKDALSIVHMNCMDIWTQIGVLANEHVTPSLAFVFAWQVAPSHTDTSSTDSPFMLDEGKGQPGTSVVQPGTARTRKKVSWDPSLGKPPRYSGKSPRHSRETSKSRRTQSRDSRIVKQWLLQNC